jgi:hypothetical protein
VSLAARPALAARTLSEVIVDFRITPDDRARFKRCRRQWDFASPNRRDLEPIRHAEPDLPTPVKDALALYYYPGTWDWSRQIVLPLVDKAFLRSVTDSVGSTDPAQLVAAGRELLDRYFAWAPTVDDFAPIRIDYDMDVLIPDPREPDRGLQTPDGQRVIYAARVDLLAVDSTDSYWVIRHQVVPDWQDVNLLILDQEAVATCWAWEQTYLGMEIAGTIHNEVRTTVEPNLVHPPVQLSSHWVAQHGPSGGGRPMPQHRRMYAKPPNVNTADRLVHHFAGPVRRTVIRRTREEITGIGRLIGAEALEMTDPQLVTYPSPATHCADCAFVAPCLAMTETDDPTPALTAGYRRRPARVVPKPRLGQTTWSFGRGAAPPAWDSQ